MTSLTKRAPKPKVRLTRVGGYDPDRHVRKLEAAAPGLNQRAVATDVLLETARLTRESHRAVELAKLQLDRRSVELGLALRAWRTTCGLSLRACARALQISAPYLCDIEHGRRSSLTIPILDLLNPD